MQKHKKTFITSYIASYFSHETGGWLEEEHTLFVVILDQYPHDVNNRRMLYIDRLKREFPHKIRHEIVSVYHQFFFHSL